MKVLKRKHQRAQQSRNQCHVGCFGRWPIYLPRSISTTTALMRASGSRFAASLASVLYRCKPAAGTSDVICGDRS